MNELLRCIEDILESSNAWITGAPDRNKWKKRSNIQLYNGWAFFQNHGKTNNILLAEVWILACILVQPNKVKCGYSLQLINFLQWYIP